MSKAARIRTSLAAGRSYQQAAREADAEVAYVRNVANRDKMGGNYPSSRDWKKRHRGKINALKRQRYHAKRVALSARSAAGPGNPLPPGR